MKNDISTNSFFNSSSLVTKRNDYLKKDIKEKSHAIDIKKLLEEVNEEKELISNNLCF
jgi:hypothetical protein